MKKKVTNEVEQHKIVTCKEDKVVGSKRVHVSKSIKETPPETIINDLEMVLVDTQPGEWKKAQRKKGKKEKLSDYYNT